MAELMALAEVARSRYKMVERGRIPAMKAGARWRFSKGEETGLLIVHLCSGLQRVARVLRNRP